MNTLNSTQTAPPSKQAGAVTLDMTPSDRDTQLFFDLYSDMSAKSGSEDAVSDDSMRDIDQSSPQQETTEETVEPKSIDDKNNDPGNSATFTTKDADLARHVLGSIADPGAENGTVSRSHPETVSDIGNASATRGIDGIRGTTASVQIASSISGSMEEATVSTRDLGRYQTILGAESGGDSSRDESLGKLFSEKVYPNRTDAGQTGSAFPGQELAAKTATNGPSEQHFGHLEAITPRTGEEQNRLPFPDVKSTRPVPSKNGIGSSTREAFTAHKSGTSDLERGQNHTTLKSDLVAEKTADSDRITVADELQFSNEAKGRVGQKALIAQMNQSALSDQAFSGFGVLDKEHASPRQNGLLIHVAGPAANSAVSERDFSEQTPPKPPENQSGAASRLNQNAVRTQTPPLHQANSQDSIRTRASTIRASDHLQPPQRLSGSVLPELNITAQHENCATFRLATQVAPGSADEAGTFDGVKKPILTREWGNPSIVRTAFGALEQRVAGQTGSTQQTAEQSSLGPNHVDRDRQPEIEVKSLSGQQGFGSHDQTSDHMGKEPKPSNTAGNLTISGLGPNDRQVASVTVVQPRNSFDRPETATNGGSASSDSEATVHNLNLATSPVAAHRDHVWINASFPNSGEGAEDLLPRQAPPPVNGPTRRPGDVGRTQLNVPTTQADQAVKSFASIAGGNSMEGLGVITGDLAPSEPLIVAGPLLSGFEAIAQSGRAHALPSASAGPQLPTTAQIFESLPTQPGQSVEIVLRPEELGRIRMTLTPSDGGMVLTVVADRAETLDLMRRNIGDLGSELNRMGYESVDFSFSQSGDDQDLPQNQPGSDDGVAPGSAEVDDRCSSDSIVSGIDMRV